MIFPMIRFLFLIFFLCTFGSFPAVADSKTCIPSKHASLEGLTVSIPISEFRNRLVSNGWQSDVVRRQDRPARHKASYGYLFDYIDQGYWEVVACSPTGLSYCKFHWTDVYQNLLAVITAGERKPDGVVDQYVTRFVFDCDR